MVLLKNNINFTLDKYRKVKENYYNNKNECLKHKDNWKLHLVTNPRFKLFDQIYFHAGDKKDINKYGLLPLRYIYSLHLSNEKENKKDKKDKKETIYKLYRKIDYESIDNTFKYMFYKFKKGIFVIIRNNKLELFLPFSNANYKNNWVKQTYFTEEEKTLLLDNEFSSVKSVSK